MFKVGLWARFQGREKRQFASSHPSICLSVYIILAATGQISMKFDIWKISGI
jgi:hypothetical protein